MKISVIVPVYNTSKYLVRCLNSLINQSLYDVEFIIVNDGSTDNSSNIISDFCVKDKRIIVINKDNSGLSSARNSGLEVSKGEYILHIDSDDWIEDNYLKDMYDKAISYNLDIVVSDIIWDWDDGTIKYKKDLDIDDDEIISSDEYLSKFSSLNVSPVVWNKLFKAELYFNNNITHPDGLSLGEDLATTPLLASHAINIGKINKAYVHYIQNCNSISNKIELKKVDELFDALKIVRSNIKYLNLDEYEFKTLSYVIFAIDLNDKHNYILINILIDKYIMIARNLKEFNNLTFKLKFILFILKIFPCLLAFKTIKKIGVFLKLL